MGAVADLVFDPLNKDAVFNSTGNFSIVNQLYMYWNVSENVTLSFGNWNTFLSYRVISTTGYDLTDLFYLGFNTTYNTTSLPDKNDYDKKGFYGFALYAQLALSDAFELGARREYFSEFGAFGAIDQIGSPDFYDDGDAIVFAVKLSGNVTLGGDLTLIPEFRLDTASEDGFLIVT